MSHHPQRKEKDCLNCGTVVHGRYCHVCGQENKEPKESFWHLLTHFFNDITHFDGKFFSSLKLLLTRPGFLSREYMLGRRVKYLNPIRMYIFTSAIFFLILYSFFSSPLPPDTISISRWEDSMRVRMNVMNDSTFKIYLQQLVLTDSGFDKNTYVQALLELENKKKNTIYVVSEDEDAEYMNRLSNKEYRWLYNKIRRWRVPTETIVQMPGDSFRHFLAARIMRDTSISKNRFMKYLETAKRGLRISFGDTKYSNRREYDSLLKKGEIDDNWLIRQLVYRQLAINEKYEGNPSRIISSLEEKFTHSIPQMLFVSLPIIALVLKLLYWRRKQFYYTDHGIFAVHIYIFIFLILLLILGLNVVEGWLHTGVMGIVRTVFLIGILFYVYKAMRNFYRQKRFKTMMKFLLLLFCTLITSILLFSVFLFFSFFRI